MDKSPPSGMMTVMLDIVLYEEDFLMRNLLREWLTEAGYRVHLAASRDLRSDRPADLVIVSVYMPKHAGAKCLHDIRAAHPDTPMIAISGQFRSGLTQDGATAQALGVQQVIAKPLVRNDFLRSVRGIIGTPA
jgi:DNA-binding response OmpR family regulator